MEIRHSTHPNDVTALATAELRSRFLLEDLFAPGEIRLALTHDDRLVIGGVVPESVPLPLQAPDQLRAAHFCEQRELAVINVGDSEAWVSADGTRYTLSHHDVLYIGAGTAEIVFEGASARLYLVSAPASIAHPTSFVPAADAEALHLGDEAGANVRTLRRYIHPGGVASDRLMLGITTLARGSVWNTMPPHTHDRRTEVYLYTGLSPRGRVMHFCGQPEALRTIVVSDGQAVISPPWSVHSGAGTEAYSFVWAMAGENQAFDDMDGVNVAELR